MLEGRTIVESSQIVIQKLMNSMAKSKPKDPLSKNPKVRKEAPKRIKNEKAASKKIAKQLNPALTPPRTGVPGSTASPCQFSGRLVLRGSWAHGRVPSCTPVPYLFCTCCLILGAPGFLVPPRFSCILPKCYLF